MSNFRNAILAFAISACLITAAIAADEKKWKTAIVLDTGSESSYAGSTTTDRYDPYRQRGQPSPYPAGSTSTARYSTTYSYVLDAGEYVYVVEANPRWRWSKVPSVTVNATVKYILEGKRDIRIIGDDGKEHKLYIAKRILKPKTN